MKVPQKNVGVYEEVDVMNEGPRLSKDLVPSPALASHLPSKENFSAFTQELCADSFLHPRASMRFIAVLSKGH